MSIRQLDACADAPGPLSSAERRRGAPLLLKCLFFAAMVLLYVLVAAVVVFLAFRSGKYPSGADTMFYIYRGDFLYRSITQEGNWYPLIDMAWYNGVQTWRYWSPLSAFILAGCQGIAGGDSFNGYLLGVGVFYVLSALVWLIIGYTHRRPFMGAFIGLLWFLVPNNAFMFFEEGVLARSMSMCVLPWFLVSVYDYLHRPVGKRWSSLVGIMASYLFIIMCHLGWAGMLAIALLLFFLFYKLLYPKGSAPIGPVLISMILCVVITGLWTYPSLVGGITGIDSSSIMRSYFQSLNLTVNPFCGGSLNRWIANPGKAYFGGAAFALALFGLFFSRRAVVPGFATALSICLLTSTAAYPILAVLPGAQYLWMLRFVSIALTFLFVSFFFWRSLKKHFQAIIAVLLVCEVCLGLVLVAGDGSTTGLSPEQRYNKIAEDALLDQGKALTTQRFSVAEPFSSVLDAIYVIAGYGEDAVPTSYGQGVQAAPQYTNIVRVNQAAENGQFLYMFDRLLELGNDTVAIPTKYLDARYQGPVELDAAAARVGYRLAAETNGYRLYHIDTPETFGVVSTYRAAAIGTGAGDIALGFPAVQELTEVCLDHYTYEDLAKYDVIYLAGFTYEDKKTAEQLVLDLSEDGVRFLIMADGMPADEHTGSKTFLDVSCNTVNFQNGYPVLETIDGPLICDLFADGYSKDWKTVYVNGLDDVWGTITDVPEGKMDFYGTTHNDNIVFIGLALTYHYSLTLDKTVGDLLSHALTLSSQELPKREIVPITVDYRDNVITIDAPCDNVNTTLSYHDIFRPDRPIRNVGHLTVVDRGRTVIRLVYPCLAVGLTLTIVGVVAAAAYLALMRKRFKKLEQWEAEQAADAQEAPTGETPAEPEPPAQETPIAETPEQPDAPAQEPPQGESVSEAPPAE